MSARVLSELLLFSKWNLTVPSPLVFPDEAGCSERFEASLSPRDRCWVEEGERRNPLFWQLCKMKGSLSSPDTELIMPLQLVAEHSVPSLTRCGGPADPRGRNKAKLQKNLKTLKRRRLTDLLCAHVSLRNSCYGKKAPPFF